MSFLSQSGHVTDPDALVVAPNTWLRNTRRTRAWAAMAVVWSVVFAGLVLIPGRIPSHGSAAATIVLIVFYCGIGSIGLVLAYRVSRAGVWIGPDGIVIRGPFTTQSIALSDAGQFAPGLQGRGSNGAPCPMLERNGRRAAGVWALGQRNIWFRYARISDEIQPLCDELNKLVAAQRRTSH